MKKKVRTSEYGEHDKIKYKTKERKKDTFFFNFFRFYFLRYSTYQIFHLQSILPGPGRAIDQIGVLNHFVLFFLFFGLYFHLHVVHAVNRTVSQDNVRNRSYCIIHLLVYALVYTACVCPHTI